MIIEMKQKYEFSTGKKRRAVENIVSEVYYDNIYKGEEFNGI